MAIESQCSGCGALLKVDDIHAGQAARCPQCGQIYTVPDRSPTEPSEGSAAEGPEVKAVLAATWRLQTPEGQVYGPVDRKTLERWLDEGRISADCRLQEETTGPWQPAPQVFPQLGAAAPSGSPFAGSSSAASGQGGTFQEPHRGGLILALGLAGLLVTCPLLSLAAWIMGNHDMQKMRAGRMDPSGMGLTEAGRIIGMLLSLLWITVFAVALFIVLVVIAAHA